MCTARHREINDVKSGLQAGNAGNLAVLMTLTILVYHIGSAMIEKGMNKSKVGGYLFHW
jgi:hypothetical protein